MNNNELAFKTREEFFYLLENIFYFVRNEDAEAMKYLG